MVWICPECKYANMDFKKKCIHCGKRKPKEKKI
jgi:hypothetical protein